MIQVSQEVFVLGDRVLVSKDDVNKGEDVGKFGTVVGFRATEPRTVRVLLDEDQDRGGGGYYAPYELEHTQPKQAPRFVVGDRVLIFGKDKGAVLFVRSDKGAPVYVVKADNANEVFSSDGGELLRIDETDTPIEPIAKFHATVGDVTLGGGDEASCIELVLHDDTSEGVRWLMRGGQFKFSARASEEIEHVHAPTPTPVRTDTLQALWDSTRALYTRFGVAPTPEATRRVFNEEVLEFVTELIHTEVSWKKSPRVADEAADVLVTLLGALMPVCELHELHDAIERVIAKNDAKTQATHHVNSAGKIARKVTP